MSLLKDILICLQHHMLIILRGVVAEAKSSSILDKLVTDSAQRDVDSVSDAYQVFCRFN